MKKLLVLCLILPLLIGCASTPGGANKQRQTLDALGIARDSYNTIQNVLADLHRSGRISDEVWQTKIVPADHAAHDAIERAYGLLKIWVATGSEDSFAQYAIALEEVFKFIAMFRQYSTSGDTSDLIYVPAELSPAYVFATGGVN